MTAETESIDPGEPVPDTVAGLRVYRYREIGSTNDAAFRIAANEHEEMFWVTAGRQTAARGRRGRAWRTGAGNLAASCFIRVPGRLEIDWLPFAAGLALHDAIADCAPAAQARVRLKWPNDLLIDGAKISGILLEAGADERHRRIVVGFGVNIAAAPPPEDVERPATSLKSAAISTTPDALFAALAVRFSARMALVQSGALARLRADWLDRAAGLGEAITVRLPNETLHGRFADLSTDGRLVLERPGGESINVSAGDVFLGAASATPARS